MASDSNILAVDVGSSFVKFGWFGPEARGSGKLSPLPAPQQTIRVEHRQRPVEQWTADVDACLDKLPPAGETMCIVASVHRDVAEKLLARLAIRPWSKLVTLHAADLPLEVRVAEPEKVGVDRLLGALAANRCRRLEASAVVVDMGTAITVDLLGPDGAFEGGAILAGPALALAALHAGTASLPRLDATILARPPVVVGKSTVEAMTAGAYWGTVGAVREMIARLADECATPPQVFLTGGDAVEFAPLVGVDDQPARHVPHLVLAGICLAADKLTRP